MGRVKSAPFNLPYMIYILSFLAIVWAWIVYEMHIAPHTEQDEN